MTTTRQPGPFRRPYLRWRSLSLVAGGGAIGTAARATLVLLTPSFGGLPVSVFLINIVGAFLLGALIDTVSTAADAHRALSARLLLGTGVLGGFTTYSTLSVGVVLLLQAGRWVDAVGYALLSVVVGVVAAFLGAFTSARIRRRRSGRRP